LDLDLAEQDPRVQEWAAIVGQHFRSYLSAPIVVGDQVYGAISLFYERPRKFAEDELELAASFADQAALAIENERLRAQAEEAAVAAERNRLARDLHDAVTQTLFSSSLIAEVLPRLWERNPEEGQRRLAELRELTRGALAEMRTLLLELRPAALAEANLADLLRQLAESITGRARVPVSLEVEGECKLEPEVKVALYRIAQEALNNVAKHAGASEATVRLVCQLGEVALSIRDDGLGFAPQQVGANSLGLGIMRERAEAIGADLLVQSEVGEGTQVSVVWGEDGGRLVTDDGR
jgi:two-component system nitrate/nitrite sensor histidine kinase NarX